MLRFLILCLLPLPASAWTFRAAPICTIEHLQDASVIQVTFDPGSGIYALHIERPGGWPAAPVFSVRFEGDAPITISTTRHVVQGNRLTVEDRGFGNVLTGLVRNKTATATLGTTSLPIDLTGAAAEVAAFEACPADGLV